MIIWLASYPKSGNTWVRTIINQIIFNDVKSTTEVFDNLSRIRRYPSKTDIVGLPQLPNHNVFTKEQKKEVIDFTIKNWSVSQDKINKNNKTNILKTHNILCKLNLDGKNYSQICSLFRDMAVRSYMITEYVLVNKLEYVPIPGYYDGNVDV